METLLLLLCLLHSINPTYPIYATVCACNSVMIRGILDIQSPYHCSNEQTETQHLSRIPTAYTLITNQKPAATWKGWTCKQWTKTKKITGSFWIGSFDTVYSQETKLITPLECWQMINDKKGAKNTCWLRRMGSASLPPIQVKGNGNGYLEIPRSPEKDNSSNLYDDNRQLQISFFNKPDEDVAVVGYKVIGIHQDIPRHT
ncbi:Uncharacterized protein APZ42_033955 [Daphnia magna]|uniref:Uncharacterized protein n=1 Tax=Daphnia magna TaxID=35525 RepID=A0A164KKI9_9CRUS|nr:Uncharacterized protein APZ42_033955 [Daphnia magna]